MPNFLEIFIKLPRFYDEMMVIFNSKMHTKLSS